MITHRAIAKRFKAGVPIFTLVSQVWYANSSWKRRRCIEYVNTAIRQVPPPQDARRRG